MSKPCILCGDSVGMFDNHGHNEDILCYNCSLKEFKCNTCNKSIKYSEGNGTLQKLVCQNCFTAKPPSDSDSDVKDFLTDPIDDLKNAIVTDMLKYIEVSDFTTNDGKPLSDREHKEILQIARKLASDLFNGKKYIPAVTDLMRENNWESGFAKEFYKDIKKQIEKYQHTPKGGFFTYTLIKRQAKKYMIGGLISLPIVVIMMFLGFSHIINITHMSYSLKEIIFGYGGGGSIIGLISGIVYWLISRNRANKYEKMLRHMNKVQN